MSRLIAGRGNELSSDLPLAAGAKFCGPVCWMKCVFTCLLAKPEPRIGCGSFGPMSEHMLRHIGLKRCAFQGGCRRSPINGFQFRTGEAL